MLQMSPLFLWKKKGGVYDEIRTGGTIVVFDQFVQ